MYIKEELSILLMMEFKIRSRQVQISNMYTRVCDVTRFPILLENDISSSASQVNQIIGLNVVNLFVALYYKCLLINQRSIILIWAEACDVLPKKNIQTTKAREVA